MINQTRDQKLKNLRKNIKNLYDYMGRDHNFYKIEINRSVKTLRKLLKKYNDKIFIMTPNELNDCKIICSHNFHDLFNNYEFENLESLEKIIEYSELIFINVLDYSFDSKLIGTHMVSFDWLNKIRYPYVKYLMEEIYNEKG